MNVLSLFDGISCGRVALERAGIKVDNYFASEIDKFAIEIAKKNYPDTVHVGSVVDVRARRLPKIDILIGGSPCQGFSFAGKQLNFEDARSKLFFEYVRLLKHCKPKYFLLENVKMKKEYQDVITEYLGVEPILINSALVSAQNRQRLYWTNIPNIEQPEDRGILLRDILEDGCVDRDKSYCIDANYFKGGNIKQYFDKGRRQLIFKYGHCKIREYKQDSGKTPTLTTMQGGHREPKVLIDNYRKLTPIECERLQTLPDNYTDGVSNSQRYKQLGNGWTVDVIAHIFKGIK